MYTGKLEYECRMRARGKVKSLVERFVVTRDYFYSIISSFMVALLALVPARARAMIKEKLQFVVGMPYKNNILINIDSFWELRRAGFCYRERDTVKWIEKCAHEGGVLYDVGANVGAVSLIYASNIKTRKLESDGIIALCFEPSPFTFGSLCKNIIHNNFQGKLVPMAFPLSDQEGVYSFSLSSIIPGASGHATTNDSQKIISELNIPTFHTTIDALHYSYGYPPPRYLKIDVDGHDYQVLLGAKRVIAENFVKEVLIEKNQMEKEIRSFLEGFGFKQQNVSDEKDINLVFCR